MKLKVGQRLCSTVDAVTVVVIRAPEREIAVTCGGAEMADAGRDSGVPDPSQQEGALLGKRYANDELGLELLCTKAGPGTLAADGQPLPVKDAKPLPASD